jgi:hypothetical protein
MPYTYYNWSNFNKYENFWENHDNIVKPGPEAEKAPEGYEIINDLDYVIVKNNICKMASGKWGAVMNTIGKTIKQAREAYPERQYIFARPIADKPRFSNSKPFPHGY